MMLMVVAIVGIVGGMGCSKKVTKVGEVVEVEDRVVFENGKGVGEGEGKVVEVNEGPMGGGTLTVYFDFDDAGLRWDAKDVLRGIYGWGGDLEVVGHCDERGSEEYNIGLGMRRAEAVRGWLVGHGVSGGMEVRSCGEGDLVNVGCRDEECHQENRRVVVRY
jgi:peptidoglycan-associated lipoprotein